MSTIKKVKEKIEFKCTGEWLTQQIRDRFWKQKKSYAEVEKFCFQLLDVSPYSKFQSQEYVRQLIEGRAKLVGVTPDVYLEADDSLIKPLDTHSLVEENRQLKAEIKALKGKLSKANKIAKEYAEVIENFSNKVEEQAESLNKWNEFGKKIMDRADPIYKLRVAMGKGILDELTFYHEIFPAPRSDKDKRKFGAFCDEFGIYPGIGEHGDWRWISFYDKKTDELLSNEQLLERGIAIREDEPEKSNEATVPDIKEQEPEEKQKLGWLSPMGEFIESGWGTHEESALDIIEKRGWKKEYREWRHNGRKDTAMEELGRDFLVWEKGWVLLDNPTIVGRVKLTYNTPRLTKKQREFLYGYFCDMGDMFKANQFIQEE